jgi:hypothetical protein
VRFVVVFGRTMTVHDSHVRASQARRGCCVILKALIELRSTLDVSEALGHRFRQGHHLERVAVPAVKADAIRTDGKKQELARVAEDANKRPEVKSLANLDKFLE